MKRYCTLILLILFSWNLVSVTGQSENTIYLLRDNAIVEFGTTGVQHIAANPSALSLPITNLSNPNHRYVASAVLTATATHLYALFQEGQLSPQRPFPTHTWISRIDTTSGISVVIYDHPGIFAFALSPDEQHMTVGYYEADYYFSAERACILNLSVGDCSPIQYQVFSDPGAWIDNTHILLPSSNDGHMHVINITNNEDIRLPLPPGRNLSSGRPIPNTRLVLMGAEAQDLTQQPLFGFFTVNIDTFELQMLPYGESSTVVLYGISPDHRYLVYGDTHPKLVEFASGRLVRQFDSIVNLGWIGDHTLVYQGRVEANSEPEIATIDSETGERSQLAAGDQASGILLIPHQ